MAARTRSTSGKSRQPGTFTGLTVPAEASTGPALPMPTASARPHSGEPHEIAEHLLHGLHDRLAVLLGGRAALGPGEYPSVAVHQSAA